MKAESYRRPGGAAAMRRAGAAPGAAATHVSVFVLRPPRTRHIVGAPQRRRIEADAMTWIWWAPLAAAALHITEEFVFPGGFADWDRAYRPKIRGSITPGLHVVVNAFLLFLCFSVALAGVAPEGAALGPARVRSVFPPRFASAAWLALAALLASNAVFHLVGAFRTRRYSPGMVTGGLLYLPLALFGYGWFLGRGGVSVGVALLAAVLGGSYHLWAALLHRARTRGAAGATGSRD
jgi:Protein of unknown function with HXXEE motif